MGSNDARTRFDLAKRLFEKDEAFRSIDLVERLPGGSWAHPHKQLMGLVQYLLLTCFDRLGQTEEFIDYDGWLETDDAAQAAEQLRSSDINGSDLELSKALHRKYLDRYGTSRSFFRFIDEVLSDEQRTELLRNVQRVRTYKTKKPETNANDKQKKTFLFQMRNDFTHSLTSHASSGNWIVPLPVVYEAGALSWGYQPVSRTQKSDGTLEWQVRRWPFVLFETVADALEVPAELDAPLTVVAMGCLHKDVRYKDLNDFVDQLPSHQDGGDG